MYLCMYLQPAAPGREVCGLILLDKNTDAITLFGTKNNEIIEFIYFRLAVNVSVQNMEIEFIIPMEMEHQTIYYA